MNFKLKLDFCIIPSPYSKTIKNVLFLSYRGTNRIDEKLCLEEEYEAIRNILSKHGYQEVDFCTFESSNNVNINVEDVKRELVRNGLKYSKPLEFNIVGEIDSFHKEILSSQEAITKEYTAEAYFSTTTPVPIIQPKSKVPEIGEKMTLYFYLFLQCRFITENDCILEMIGDLYSKENSGTKNFIQIMKSEFVRLDSKSPNVIKLQSIKTYGDFMREINILHKGNFGFQKPLMNKDGDMVLKTKEFMYNFIEIKKNINPNHKIIVDVNLNKHYDNMVDMSKKIRKEFNQEQKKIISLDSIRPEIIELKDKLSKKMLYLAEVDEFEKAGIVKTDINFIDDKLQIIENKEDKNITCEEYFKTFCLNK